MQNPWRWAIEIAQDLLVKKLGELAHIDNTDTVPNPDDFDLYAQHFARPVEKTTMDAIQDLIKHAERSRRRLKTIGRLLGVGKMLTAPSSNTVKREPSHSVP